MKGANNTTCTAAVVTADGQDADTRPLNKRARSVVHEVDEDRLDTMRGRSDDAASTQTTTTIIIATAAAAAAAMTNESAHVCNAPHQSNAAAAVETNNHVSDRERNEQPVVRDASGTRSNREARFQDRRMPSSFHELLGPYEEPDEAKDVEEMGEGYADFDDLPLSRREALMQSVRRFAAHIAHYERTHGTPCESGTDTQSDIPHSNDVNTTTSSSFSKRQQRKLRLSNTANAITPNSVSIKATLTTTTLSSTPIPTETSSELREDRTCPLRAGHAPPAIPLAELEHWRVKASRLPGLKDTARKSELIAAYRQLVRRGELTPNAALEHCLMRKRGKSHSGVLVVTVFMGPGQFSCPKDCHYCPAQPGVARSYLLKEPGVLRGFRNGWDPIRQFYDRASALECNGHVVDKIELIILGGTFSFYPVAYVEEFMTASFYAANTFYDAAPLRAMGDLSSEIAANEAARCRVIGVTIETRPDYIHVRELRRLRQLGVTRVQLGIQHLDDDILDVINRDCPTVKTVRAIRLLLDAGFKVDAHWMPDLPGSSYARDRDMFERLLSPENESFQVDQWKVYPTATVPYTKISEWYREGRYRPYAETEGGRYMVELLLFILQHCPERIRLNRIIRDIPTTYIMAGERRCNLRQILEQEMRTRRIVCRDIRARECKGETIDPAQARLYVDEFRASEGTELYLSIENTTRTRLYGHLRLRLRNRSRCPYCAPHVNMSVSEEEEEDDDEQVDPHVRANSQHCVCPKTHENNHTHHCTHVQQPLCMGLPVVDNDNGESVMAARYSDDAESALSIFPALRGCALIRELHTYGRLVAVHGANTGQATQHMGVGTRLVRHAERIARRRGYHAVAIIAGVGVRTYYARLGYHLEDTYMVRRLDQTHVPPLVPTEGVAPTVLCEEPARASEVGVGGVMTRLRSWMSVFHSGR